MARTEKLGEFGDRHYDSFDDRTINTNVALRLQWCRATPYIEGVQALKDKPVECAARQFVKFTCAMEKALECMAQASDLLVLGLLVLRFRQVERAAQLAHNQKRWRSRRRARYLWLMPRELKMRSHLLRSPYGA